MDEQPKEITVCNLQVILMPQGEIICLGKTVGWFKNLKKYLTVCQPTNKKGEIK